MINAEHDITGLILAGGRASRMGGTDKGWLAYRGRPLIERALERLRPQVGQVMVNANRNLEAYRALGVPVWPDESPDYCGPLAGILAGLVHCRTALVAAVPCDAPRFPLDLVPRLAQALDRDHADLAVASTRNARGIFPQPVFCLVRAGLAGALRAFIAAGERKAASFAQAQRHTQVIFEDESAFLNLNTPDDLEERH